MRQLKRIIVGHDLRAGGEAALQSAAVLAHRSGAALKLVHVVEPYHFYQRVYHPFAPPHTLEEIAQKAGEKLEALAARAELAPLRVEYEIRTGKPFIELIIACRGWQADLIVVGGTAQREAHVLGSTSARVVRKAMVPVLVAKRPLTAGAKTFLVPTDFSSCASKAAEEALALAESFGGRVFFFHALDLSYLYVSTYGLDMATLPPIPPLTAEDIEGEWQAFLSGLPALTRVSWDKRTEEGRAATSIVQQAEESQADVIVIGTHGGSGLAHMLLGSVAEEVVCTAPCPILTVRPEAFQFELP